MRNIKKILLVLLMITTFFGITNVKALEKDIQVTDINVKEKSGTITVVDPVVTDNEVTSNITFNQKDDFVTFELTLKNNESKKYKIESITDNNTNNNIKAEYSFNKDYISTGETSKVTIKLTYKNQLLNVDQISLNDLTIKISLVNEDGDSEEIIINPTTGDNIFHYLLLLIVALVGIGLIVAKKKIKGIKIGSLFVVLAVVLLPLAVFANEKYEIKVKFNDIVIKGEFETYSISIDPGNGAPVETRQITYGQKIGDLPADPSKDGYTFDKWVDEEGNEVTKDTVITKEISVIASYNLVTYNITYDLSGGNLPSGKSNPETYTIESQSITLNNPTKEGYTFTGWTGTGIETQTTSVTIPHGSTGDRTYQANYSASDDTAYKVIHKFAKLNGEYDTEEVIEHGTTGTTVPAPRKTRTGFVTPTVQNVYIAADGKAEITYTYERELYSFSIPDRTYIDETVSTPNESYPYETPITVKALEREGYGFTWDDGVTDYERTFDLTSATSLTPVYTPDQNTPYTVKHYKMKIAVDDYELAETQELSGETDSPITPAVNTYEGFTSPATQSTTIGGDGHTVVEYYYTRNQVTVTMSNTDYIVEGDLTGSYYYEQEITLTAKERPGYTMTGWTTGETTNPVTITVGTSDFSVGPEYTAKTNTPYIVNHYQMNLDGEHYTIAETEDLTGTTDSPITPATKTYDGFTSPETYTTTISGNNDTVVNYYYTRNQYTLTITNSQFVVEDKSGPHYYDEEITLTAIDRQGYTFAGWNTGETTKTITFSMPVDGITVEPLYTASDSTTYSVTHKYRKLTTEEEYEVVTVNGTGTTGDTIPAPLRPQTGFVTPNQVNITITPDGEANVVYTYQRETYTFSITDRTYLDNTSTPNDTYPYGTTITLKAIEREGYSFKWSDNVTDLERSFELESSVTNLSLIYTANAYTLTAHANNGAIAETTGWTGTGDTATKEITYNSTYGTLPTVSRTGYTLDRWNTSQDGNGTDITSATTVTTTSNQDIYAIWTPREDTAYKVIHKKQNVTLDGYEDIVENLTGTTGALITPTVNTYTGFISPNAETTTIAADGSTEVVYTYNRETYTVSFDTDGGSTVPAQTVAYGAKVTEPSDNPTKEHYNFIDWYTTDSYSTAFDFAETTISGPTTIYAKFEIKTFTVSFDTNGGSTVPAQTVSYGGLVLRPTPDPTKTGLTFDDWYTNTNFNTKFDFANTQITDTTTIYANFIDTCGTFSTDSWSTIKTNFASDPNYYGVGCEKEVEIDMNDDSTPESYTARIANTSSPSVCETSGYSQTACGTVIEFVDIVEMRQMNSTNTNAGGWKSTAMVTYLNSDFYNKLPSDLQDIIIPTYPIVSGSGSGGVSDNITEEDITKNKIYLLSGREVGLDLEYDNKKDVTTETRTLDYYSANNNNNARKKRNLSGNAQYWWLRSASSSAAVAFCNVYSNGTSRSSNAALSYGVAPAFRIGIAPSFTVSFDTDGGSTVADIEVDAGDSINELPTPTKADSVFIGWFESVTDENPVTEPYTPSGDITLIAKWNNIICKKATTLHTETCNQTNSSKYCSGDGYTNGDTITYGNIVSSDTYEAGDAFDCDVDGTGYNQRFYYLRTNDNKAVLISNKNYTEASKQADQNISFIYSQAHDQLPTTSDWGNLPVKFDGKPARLITMEDLLTVTGASNPSDITSNGSLKGYEFLFESSNFSGIGERSTQWVEEISSTERYRYRNDQYNLAKVNSGEENTSKNPVRPVIEVPLNLIEDAYVVKFDANGGNTTSEYSKVIKGNSLGTLPTATREGYIFDGWYTSLEFTTEVTENTIPNGYVTYYAKWTGDISDASFAYSSFILSIGDEDDIVINNSSDYESVTYTSNDTSIVTVNNSGHLTAVADGETTITVTGSKSGHTRTINVKVAEEITEFVVHFDSMGGSSVNDMNVPINTAIGSLPEDPVLAENIFAGWYTNTNYSTKVTTDTVIRNDVTFYAKWIPENAVAEINHSYFTSLQDAFDSEMTGKTTIILLKDISVNNTYLNLYTKNLGKDIVLDLNNKTITGTGSQTIRTKTSLEIKNGTITQSSSNGTIDIGSGGHLIINSGTVINTGSRAAIYNDGGTVELGGTVNITSNAEWAGNNNRGTVQNKSGTTIITGGTIINTRSSNSYAVSAAAGTLTIGTKDDIYNTTNLVIQGETGGIYSAVNYSLYDGMIKGITAAVENESKITSIEDNATKVNDVDGSYNILYYTVPNNKYRIDLDAGEGTVNPTYILIDAGDQIGTLPTPTRGVYTFDGWFDSNDVEADPTHQPTSSETYYAKWHYEASNEIVEFRTTNDAMAEYYDKIDIWKVSSSNFPSWSSSNNSPNWALDATENTPMKNNFDANNCQCADGQCSSSGTVACDKPKGYSTGLSEKVNVYLSDAVTKAKGDLVTYAKANNGVIYNLIPGQVYYWEAESDENVHGYVKFTGERRILDTGDVRNTRDLGGLPVDTDSDGTIDGEIKYGKLFRGIKLNSASSVTELVNLGVTEEFDLRESNSDPYKLSDVSGKKYHRIEAQNYYVNYNPDNATEMGYYNMTRSAVKYAMEEIVNGENIYFHCRIGTDRTGTVAYVLEGLLGVPEEDRVQDYELSFFYGLIRIHRYHNEKPGSSVGTGKERFVYMHNFMPTNSDIFDWYMAGSTNTAEDQALINAFRTKMITVY